MSRHQAADPIETGREYDSGADGFDARFAADPRTVRAFGIIDAPQRAIADGRRRVLEIGCGTGRLLAAIDAAHRVGIDVSKGLLRVARTRGLAVAGADAHALPFGDASFDAVVGGNGVFRYLDYGRALRECARVLRPGGRLAVHQYAAITWRLSFWRRPAPPDQRHLRDLGEIRRPARAAGLCEEGVFLWRRLRFRPYVVRLPEPLAFRLWSHATLIFRKPWPPC